MTTPLHKRAGRLLRGLAGMDPCYPYRAFNDRLRCIFVHIPKTAGTSILQAMGAPTTGRRHVEWFHYQEADAARFADYFKFTAVRDPADRASSLYRYYSQGGNGQDDDVYVRDVIRHAAGSFDEFVANILASPRFASWNVFKPQTAFIFDRRGRLQLDFVLRVEQLDTQYEELRRLLPGLPASLPHANRSLPAHNIGEVISESTLGLLQHLYLDDYRLLYPEQLR